MTIRKCNRCGKAIPADSELDLCSLCRAGLTPAISPRWNLGRDEPPMVVQGRALTGLHCPICHAELTQADFSHLNCAICGETFTSDRLRMLEQQAASRKILLAETLKHRVPRRR